MIKRNRNFVFKIIFLICVYFIVTTMLNSNSDISEEKLQGGDSEEDNIEVVEHEVHDNIDNVLEPDPQIMKNENFGNILIEDDHQAQPHPPVENENMPVPNNLDEIVKDKIEDDKAAEEQNFAILPPKNAEGPGEMGKPHHVNKSAVDEDTQKRIDKGWLNNAYNEYVSDLISVHRSLRDLRDDWCKAPDRHLQVLPQTSVIVCFHNEAWSVLLRSVHSILNRSPEELLKEIILVDDASDMDHLKDDLANYMSQYPKVKIVRAPERVGLIRARLMGASKASAPILTFLDSHIECTPGWLEPLLDRIARDPTNVVCPVIDVIDTETLEYMGSSYFAVGGFDWNLQFNWHPVPEHENKRRGHSWAPAHSPTMAGGLFSIDKNFFEKLGTYDNGFDIWGAENLELSFKTWMCGGTLEIVPCSHVGHIFRKRSPYKWRSNVNVVVRNSVRLAEVWLDDYKKYYYNRIGNSLGEFGDISSRIKLRENLGCKSFKWYLDTIFPELFIPGDSAAQGEIRNIDSHICLDSNCQPKDLHKPVGLWPCHNQGGNQYWLWSKNGEIRRDEHCLDYGGTDVILYPCHGVRGNQWWIYDTQNRMIKHAVSRKCLMVDDTNQKLLMEECDMSNSRLRWDVQNFNQTALNNVAA